jgi:hypothetical protein
MKLNKEAENVCLLSVLQLDNYQGPFFILPYIALYFWNSMSWRTLPHKYPLGLYWKDQISIDLRLQVQHTQSYARENETATALHRLGRGIFVSTLHPITFYAFSHAGNRNFGSIKITFFRFNLTSPLMAFDLLIVPWFPILLQLWPKFQEDPPLHNKIPRYLSLGQMAWISEEIFLQLKESQRF